MSTQLPLAQPIATLSPTALAVLRACPLRYAFGQAAKPAPAKLEPHQALGTLCHSVLEDLVSSQQLLDEDWQSLLEIAWDARVTELRSRHNGNKPGWMGGAPETWPGLVIKRARLRNAARRLRAILQTAGQAELLCETPLKGMGGRLRGYPDLIVRGTDAHWILDYKTGGVLSQDELTPRDAYVQQLQLYAVLEHEASGSWPTRAYLLPLAGASVEIDISPQACEQLASEMIAMLDSYNEHVGAVPPAHPSPDRCRWCPAATQCPEPWERADDQWAPALLTVEGVVTDAVATRLGGMSLRVDAERGSVAPGPIAMRNVIIDDHPDVAGATSGARLRAIGMRHEGEGHVYTLPRWGRISIEAPSDA